MGPTTCGSQHQLVTRSLQARGHQLEADHEREQRAEHPEDHGREHAEGGGEHYVRDDEHILAPLQVDVGCLQVVSERLSEIGELPTKAPIWILQGLCICSTAKFKEPFGHLLQSKRVRNLGETINIKKNWS